MRELYALLLILTVSLSFSNAQISCSKTKDGKDCVIGIWTYSGVAYSGCSKAGSSSPWCATTVNADRSYSAYSYCHDSCDNQPVPVAATPKPVVNCDRTKDGTPCVSTLWNYSGMRYNGCSKAGGSSPWCATGVKENGDYTTYAYCHESCDNPGVSMDAAVTPTTTQASNVPVVSCDRTTDGTPCVSTTWNYSGKRYKGCSKAGGSSAWCATGVRDNGDYTTYAYCHDSCDSQGTPIDTSTDQSSATVSSPASCNMTSEGKPCVFPFIYDGMRYSGCTMKGGSSWCATKVSDGGIYSSFGYCKEGCDSVGVPVSSSVKPTGASDSSGSTGASSGGSPASCNMTSNGEPCVFPFIYDGMRYSGCTMKGGSSWCATRVSDGGSYASFGYCKEGCDSVGVPVPGWVKPADAPEIPGVANSAGSGAEKPNRSPASCNTTDQGQPCVFPFVSSGLRYSGCTKSGGTSWCATRVADGGNWASYGWCREDCDSVGVPVPGWVKPADQPENPGRSVIQSVSSSGHRKVSQSYRPVPQVMANSDSVGSSESASSASAILAGLDLVALGIKQADINNINYSCDRTEYQYICNATGARSQFTLRWYYDKSYSNCIPYPWGYCQGEVEVATHSSIKTHQDCVEICTPK